MSVRKRSAGGRTLSLLAMLSILSAFVLFAGQFAALASGRGGDDSQSKITICHRTNSATNPYVEITIAREAADGLTGSGNQADHFGEHKGPLASSEQVAQDLKDDHIEWGDIIPNVDDDGNPMPHGGLNWTTEGQAMWRAGCVFAAPPTSPPPGAPSLALSKTGTATVTQGGAVSYTVTVSNSGTGPAMNVIVRDNLNDSLTSVSVSTTVGSCSVGAGTLVTCNIGTLNGGQSATITVNATAPVGTCPSISNQATGSHSGGTIPASGTVTTTVTGCGSPSPTPSPSPAVSIRVEKTNDANEDGTFSNNEEAKKDDLDLDFKLKITNTSDVAVLITDLTDSFDQTTLDLLAAKCTFLAGVTLDPDESIICTFTLNNYAPAQGSAIVNIAEVCVELVGGTQTDCDTNPSRVRSAVVLGRTVTPTPTNGGPPPTRTPPGGIAFTGPGSAAPLTALAFALLTLGMGLLWAGNRKREGYET
jgi:uncharacterized repeat protein (TIGR01451 family)